VVQYLNSRAKGENVTKHKKTEVLDPVTDNFFEYLNNDPVVLALRQSRALKKEQLLARQAVRAARAKVRARRADTAKDWWRSAHATTPGPSRIRVTFNRFLTPAEAEHFTGTVSLAHDPTYKIRVIGNRVWVETWFHSSRDAYDEIALFVASEYVNIFPVAVRTFRELVED
jgi:hypothetical protein